MKARMREIHKLMKMRGGFYFAYQTTKGLYFITNCIAHPDLRLAGVSRNGNSNQ